MKKITTAVMLTMVTIVSFSQSFLVQPKVDERTELLSIVFRLAEAREYMNNEVKNYAKDIDQYFKPFKDHELIGFVKTIRETNSIGYDAVMSMATAIELYNNQKLKLNENLSKDSYDKRWGNHIEKFIDLLNKFYHETKFHDFFINHQSLYHKAENDFTEILKDSNIQWLNSFFGIAPNGSINLVLSLSNGRNCYGPRIIHKNGQEDIYAVMGMEKADSLGFPIYTKRLNSYIIHEFSHSYCNPLINIHYDEMESKANKIYRLVEEKMKNQSYGNPQTMLNEILVRASVIKYNIENKASKEKIQEMLIFEKNNGFLWIEELVNHLNTYSANRDKYATLNDFFPEIVRLHNGSSLENLLKDYQKYCPKIISLNVQDGALNVDPSLQFISIKFDRPMNISYYQTWYGRKGEKFYPEEPENSEIKWDETHTEFFIPVILKPNTEYSMSFLSFRDEKGYLLNETYYLDFKTK